MDKVSALMDLLRESESTSWVAEQISLSFSCGVSMTIKEALNDESFFELAPFGLTTTERKKRENYETTRPYTEAEKLGVIIDALKIFYVDLPSIQVSGFKAIQEHCTDVSQIEFAPPDEPEQMQYGYEINIQDVTTNKESLALNFRKFKEEFLK